MLLSWGLLHCLPHQLRAIAINRLPEDHEFNYLVFNTLEYNNHRETKSPTFFFPKKPNKGFVKYLNSRVSCHLVVKIYWDMFALKSLALSAARRQRNFSTLVLGPTSSTSYYQPYHPNLVSSYQPAGTTSLTLSAPPAQGVNWWQELWENLQDGFYQMSSTLKKRRSKMNKHKLRKRRKKNRMKKRKQ